ncbi:neural cell adhesion molecule 2-like [Chelonus insularis]|uniref:neural cell adhesion molecule 2-like n=1 Tax=Chelonus insularis TaxID=460826 RepID=UPI00158B472B|nr:neural cell adhesion molecule 2-like [Chelonus insularis]
MHNLATELGSETYIFNIQEASKTTSLDQNSTRKSSISKKKSDAKMLKSIIDKRLLKEKNITSKSQINKQAFNSSLLSENVEHEYFDHCIETKNCVPLFNISAVEGGAVELPCDITPTESDSLHMVMWFRGHADGAPLYTVDVRNKGLHDAYHTSDANVFGPRAYFRAVVSHPAVLVLDDIKRHDAALYRCRVDFRRGQTRSMHYNLTVIVLPEEPIILNRYGHVIQDIIGPEEEGEDLILVCRVTGGSPTPHIRWSVQNVIYEQSIKSAGNVIENKLIIKSINRFHLGLAITCTTYNTNLVAPKKKTVTLDLILKPVVIKISRMDSKSADEPVKAKHRYDYECQTAGSNPPAIITWYKGRRPLKHVKEERSRNETISRVEFIPSIEDNRKQITCRAENPSAKGLFLEKSITLDVIYPPIVSLRLGSTLNPTDIKEGDDVYFECHIDSNPAPTRLAWLHNGHQLVHNATARVIQSNRSLVLQSVSKMNSGYYVCIATNSVHESRSEPLYFQIKFAPVCRNSQVSIIGASKGEILNITCRVEAHPPVLHFFWKFNNTRDIDETSSRRFSIIKSDKINGLDTLQYIPSVDLDYGLLSCWAKNEVGIQARPCLYQIVMAGKPLPVQNCTLLNQTFTNIRIKCIANYDGGLPQRFFLEVYREDPDSLTKKLLYNISSNEEPSFILSNLSGHIDSGVHVAVYAVNAKGRSQAVIIRKVSFRDAEKHTGSERSLDSSPMIITVLGVVSIFVIIILIIVLKAQYKKMFITRHRKNSVIKNHLSQYANLRVQQTSEIDPDIIPSKFDDSILEIDAAHYCGEYTSGNWLISNSTTTTNEFHCKMVENQSNRRLYSDGTVSILSNSSMTGDIIGINQGVCVAGESLDGEAIKRRLMENRLPESCV